MKIAFFVHSLSVGGAETLACNYLLKLKEFGHDVVLIQKRDDNSFLNKRISDAGIPTYTLTASGRDVISKGRRFLAMKFFIGSKLNKLLKKLKVDIFHNHISFEGIKKLPLKPQNIYYAFHTEVERSFRIYGKSHRQNCTRFIKKGINIIASSAHMIDDIKAINQGAKIYLFPNGLDLEKIRNNKYDRKEFLKSLNIEPDNFVLGHAGRYFPVKNHSKVIEIFSEIKKLRPNSKLLLIGTGNAEEKATVNALIEKYDVKNDVVQLGLRNDATSVMSVLDAFVFPSFKEGFPLVLVEVQALNLRSVVSKAVPMEAICNGNVTIMDIETSSLDWAEALLEQPENVPIKDIEDFSIINVVKNHEKIYLENL